MEPLLWFCTGCGAANAEERQQCFACSQERSEEIEEGEHLLHDRYRLLAPVGTGGFAIVYKAIDTHASDELVAIKQIHLRGLASQEAIEATDAFNRELHMLSPLKHPHLPRIHEHFTDADHWYLVMDFVEGETLEHYQERRTQGGRTGLPLTEVLSIGLQLCSVLDYLHTRQPAIIFRDLKPGNILRTTRGHLFLIDFGIARHFKPGQMKDTIPFGSPGYAAPEQYGKAQTAPSADIYSLGALLHHLLCGDDPSETPFYFAPLRLYGERELSDLEALIMRMVQMDARKRPENIGVVKAELQRLSLSEGSTRRIWSPPVGQPPVATSGLQGWQAASYATGQQQQMLQKQQYATPSFVSRRSFFKVTAGVVTLTMVGGVLAFASSKPMARSDISNDGSSFGSWQVPMTALSLTAKQVAFVTSNGYVTIDQVDTQSGNLQATSFYAINPPMMTQSQPMNGDVRTAGAFHRHRGYHQRRVVTALAWSPQATQIVLGFAGDPRVRGNTSIEVWDVTGKEGPNVISQRMSAQVNALAWSPDGTYIAAAGQNANVNVWNVSDGKLAFIEPVLDDDEQQNAAHVLAWSPDSTRIAYSYGENNVGVFDVKAGHEVSKYEGGDGGLTMLAWSPDGTYLSLVSSQDVQVWHVAYGSPVAKLPAANALVTWLSDNNHLAVVTGDGTIQVWDPLKNAIVSHRPGEYITLRALGWLPDSNQLVLASDDSQRVQIRRIPSK